MTDHLTPVAVCEELIGPLPVIAEIVGYDRSAGFGWRYATRNRAAGDFPSVRLMRRLLAHSARHGLGLVEKHLIWGAPRAEIEEILRARIEAGVTVDPAPVYQGAAE